MQLCYFKNNKEKSTGPDRQNASDVGTLSELFSPFLICSPTRMVVSSTGWAWGWVTRRAPAQKSALWGTPTTSKRAKEST